jgi:RNA polymerase sigma-70 factor, ECF subfamily
VKDALFSDVRRLRSQSIASLVRTFGFDLAEECVDAALALAVTEWPSNPPESRQAWLISVARRRAIDQVRRSKVGEAAHETLAYTESQIAAPSEPMPDERLQLIFTCCHPAIAPEAQIALALRYVCGLTTEDVARAFMVPVTTMAQRLTRARSKIEVARVPYEVPEARELPERVSVVCEVVYAIFNEGYVSTTGELARIELAEEAIYLAEVLRSLLPDDATVKGLLALLLLVHARRHARADAQGDMIALSDQDRSRWDYNEIARGKVMLEDALLEVPVSLFALEAAVQALHDESASYEATDFLQIRVLYRMMYKRGGPPIVQVNEAVALAMVNGPEAGLELLAHVDAEVLRDSPALSAARAELLARVGHHDAARAAYNDAIAKTKNDSERRFLQRRRAML